MHQDGAAVKQVNHVAAIVFRGSGNDLPVRVPLAYTVVD